MSLLKWSDTYYVYDYDDEKLLGKFNDVRQAIALCDKAPKDDTRIVSFKPLKTEDDFTTHWAYASDEDSPLEGTPKLAAKKLNKKYIKSLSVPVLEKLVSLAKDKYYNSTSPIMTDEMFDLVEKQLKKDFPKSTALTVGAAPKINSASARMTRLPYFLGSMNKFANTASFTNIHKGPYVASDKLDGNSVLYINEGGVHYLYTRGDGTNGQDISHLLPILKLPKLKSNQAIRGEMILSKTAFKKYVESARNARNMIAGLIGRKEIASELKDAHIVFYEQLSPRVKPSKAFKSMKAQGFKVVWHYLFKNTPTDKSLERLLSDRMSQSKYEIDGIILSDDNVHPVNKSGNPKDAFAFKRNFASDMVMAEVVGVEWNISRHGQWKPTILIKQPSKKLLSKYNAKK